MSSNNKNAIRWAREMSSIELTNEEKSSANELNPVKFTTDMEKTEIEGHIPKIIKFLGVGRFRKASKKPLKELPRVGWWEEMKCLSK